MYSPLMFYLSLCSSCSIISVFALIYEVTEVVIRMEDQERKDYDEFAYSVNNINCCSLYIINSYLNKKI